MTAAVLSPIEGLTSPEEASIVLKRSTEVRGFLDDGGGVWLERSGVKLNLEYLAGTPQAKRLLENAGRLAASPLPESPDDLYLEFSRSGNRSKWEKVAWDRRGRLKTLAMAEYIERKGRFLDAYRELVESLCAERTWLMPAHDRSLDNFNGKTVDIDLGASHLGCDMAGTAWLLDEMLDSETKSLVRANIERRIAAPFRRFLNGDQKCWWLRGTNNWNAVCLANVAGAILALCDDMDEKALVIAAAEHYSLNFLKGFTEDGYCSEGLGYWNYGFGNYISLSEIIFHETAGKIDLMSRPIVGAIADFPARLEIAGGVYPAFADCSVNARPGGLIMGYLSEKFGDAAPSEAAAVQLLGTSFPTAAFVYSRLGRPKIKNPAASDASDALRGFFPDAGVLVCRMKEGAKSSFGTAFKGGNNNEHHNHNDLGSFVVVVNSVPVLADIGSEVYTARTFGKNRYLSDALNSFGHPVPVIGGKLQKTGADAKAEILEKSFSEDSDSLILDITSAYDCPNLKSLRREFVFDRKGKTITLTDHVEFAKPDSFETALLSFGNFEIISESKLYVSCDGATLAVTVDCKESPVSFSESIIEADLTAKKQARRLAVKLVQKITRATVKVSTTPDIR